MKPIATPMSRPSAVVVTVSDSVASGRREDLSGAAVKAALQKHFQITKTEVVADNYAAIEATLPRLSGEADLVVTTAATAITERDATPKTTRVVCPRLPDGISERMRAEGAKKTPVAA